ncbi:MAG TPA: hypothetical protein DG754_10545 [Bacteroidales bacterium]|mgnify:CR=1 FL=1|nr:hypothetical protein [Bacteroidales bacterium]
MNDSYKVRGVAEYMQPFFYCHYFLKFKLAQDKHTEFETYKKHGLLNAMIMEIRIIFTFCMLVFVSCDKENNKPADEFTLKSTEYTGFLFEGLKIITFPNPNNLKADFVMSPQTTENDDVVSPFFAHPDLESRFYLSGEFESFDSALSSFESYIMPADIKYQQFALDIKPYQVWLIRTNTEKNGIILIKSAECYIYNDIPYAETTFKAKVLR